VTRALPSGGAALAAIALGCEEKEAGRIAYAPASFTPVGLSCRLCERADCAERAFPPLQRPLRVDPHFHGAAPFAFAHD
jgi:predicted transcriptional regulator